ncbi:copper amine oxidase N-terminal domain-containing protein [Fictibacillus halophilus]|uniref:copper amine oxidase N-terminal domain-containing protein n=1 Tax=Fictibacillus halophilus TaxID=1610490 RepID=UPI003636312C
MLKKYFALIITFVFIISMFSSTTIAADSSRIKVYMNEGELYFNTSPILKNDRTFVEMRPIFEQAQIKLSWDQRTQTVTGKKDNTTIKLKIGSKTAYVNGKPVALEAAPFIHKNYTFVPLRFIAEASGYKVEYNHSLHLIHIHKTGEFIEQRAFKEEQLTKEMLVTLREGRFPESPVGLNAGPGPLLDLAGSPKTFFVDVPEKGVTQKWIYGNYWYDFGYYENGFQAIHVKPTLTTITIDEVLDALGPAENIYGGVNQGETIYAYYEGIYMYEILTDAEGKVEFITLKAWISDENI